MTIKIAKFGLAEEIFFSRLFVRHDFCRPIYTIWIKISMGLSYARTTLINKVLGINLICLRIAASWTWLCFYFVLPPIYTILMSKPRNKTPFWSRRLYKFYFCYVYMLLIMGERSERNSYLQFYVGRFVDIKPL